MVMDPLYLIMVVVIMGVSWYVSSMLKRRFREYSQIPIGLTGREVAEKMLREYGINDVKVVSVPGALTDHYNPLTKTVNLSDWVYGQSNIAAAAVAAHECGHAVQHATAYTWLTMRSKMVPVVQVSANYLQYILLAGILVMAFSGNVWILGIGIAMFAMTTLFSFVTLPVEFDASNRALAWIDNAGVTTSQGHQKAKSALKWAAMTYVVAALGSLAQLLYYISILLRSRN
jgi:uncharacterized protein